MPTTPFPTFSANLVFGTADRKPNFGELFHLWAKGAINREIWIELEDGATEDDLRETIRVALWGGLENSALQHLTEQMTACYENLRRDLDLSRRLLAFKSFQRGEPASIETPNGEKFSWFSVEDESGKAGELAVEQDRLFIPSVPLEASAVYPFDTFYNNPKGTLQKALTTVAQQTVVADNAVLLHLLRNCVDSSEQKALAKRFSSDIYTQTRRVLWENQLPATAMIVSPELVIQMLQEPDCEKWLSLGESSSQWATGCVGRFGDMEILCDGSPSDQFHYGLKPHDFFVVATPPHLGVRTETFPQQVHDVNLCTLGKASMGWHFYRLSGKVLFGRGVAYTKIGGDSVSKEVSELAWKGSLVSQP